MAGSFRPFTHCDNLKEVRASLRCRRAILAFYLIFALCFSSAPALAFTDEPEVTYAPPPAPPTPAPTAPRYEIIPETQVNLKLVVLAYTDKPIDTWDAPDYGEGGFAVPRLYQNDFQTPICEYDGEARSVATSGCAFTCLSMALFYLTGDQKQNPDTLFREACLDKRYVGNGIAQLDILQMAKAHGLHAVRYRASIGAIRRAMAKGYPIIASMGKGYFGNGHYIILRGLNEKDELSVNDPNDAAKSERTYPLKSVVNQLKGTQPLLVLMPKDGSL